MFSDILLIEFTRLSQALELLFNTGDTLLDNRWVQ